MVGQKLCSHICLFALLREPCRSISNLPFFFHFYLSCSCFRERWMCWRLPWWPPQKLPTSLPQHFRQLQVLVFPWIRITKQWQHLWRWDLLMIKSIFLQLGLDHPHFKCCIVFVHERSFCACLSSFQNSFFLCVYIKYFSKETHDCMLLFFFCFFLNDVLAGAIIFHNSLSSPATQKLAIGYDVSALILGLFFFQTSLHQLHNFFVCVL